MTILRIAKVLRARTLEKIGILLNEFKRDLNSHLEVTPENPRYQKNYFERE